MRLDRILLFLAPRLTTCQTLADVLAAQSATLSTLTSWLESEELIYSILSSASGVTLLAPSNNAMAQLYNTPLAAQLAEDANLLTAFLSYHVLDGLYWISNLTVDRSFPTMLNIAGYSNITGGQRIISRSDDGAITFYTGNAAQSTVQPYVS